MKTSKHRNQRIADQIQRDLAAMIPREIREPSMGLVTLQSVELTPDLAHAKVYFSVLGAKPEIALGIFREKAGYLHSLLFKKLHIHTVPTLHFLHDQSIEHGLAMSQLISEAMLTTQPETQPEFQEATAPEKPKD